MENDIQSIMFRCLARGTERFLESRAFSRGASAKVVAALLEEPNRRKEAGGARWRTPFRADHGHELIDDRGRPTHQGYPVPGRLRGLSL
jgi:D-mannonate dehydratase